MRYIWDGLVTGGRGCLCNTITLARYMYDTSMTSALAILWDSCNDWLVELQRCA